MGKMWRLVGALLLTVLVAGACAGGRATSGGPGGTPSSSPAGTPGQRELLVAYERTGGIGGFNDRLNVWTDGTYRIESRQGSRAGTLSPAQLTQLRGVLDAAGFPGIPPTGSPPPYPDGFQHHVVYAGYDVRAADGAMPAALVPVVAVLAEILQRPV
jgi:hypothetical protein